MVGSVPAGVRMRIFISAIVATAALFMYAGYKKQLNVNERVNVAVERAEYVNAKKELDDLKRRFKELGY